MNNPYSSSRKNLIKLFTDSRKKSAVEKLNELIQKYSREAVEEQIVKQKGTIIDELNLLIEKFANKTENVEFLTALSLTEFYFGGNDDTKVAFELKASADPKKITNYEKLMQAIESNTHIDCAVGSLVFQIKRYPQKHLEHSNEALLKYLDKEVFPGYSSMKGTVLVLILQPASSVPEKTAFDFKKLSEALIERGISFDEVVLFYTDFETKTNRFFSVLHRLYPKEERIVINQEKMLGRLRGES